MDAIFQESMRDPLLFFVLISILPPLFYLAKVALRDVGDVLMCLFIYLDKRYFWIPLIFIGVFIFFASRPIPIGEEMSFLIPAIAISFSSWVWAISAKLALDDFERYYQEMKEKKSHLKESGTRGFGTVQKFRDTGSRYGQTSGFELTLKMESGKVVYVEVQVYHVEIANWLNRRLEVISDPNDPRNTILVDSDDDGLEMPFGEQDLLQLLGEQQSLLAELAVTGTPCLATVTEIRTSKVLINDDGIMAFLKVIAKPENEGSFYGEFPVALALANLGKYQPGMTINIRFDPEDRSRMNIDHQKQGGKISESD